MNIQVNFGGGAFSSYYNINRIIGTPSIEMRIAGRSTASCQVVADSAIVAPSTFAIGTLCNIQNFTNQPGNDGLHLVSSSAGDTTQTALIVGTDQADALQYETVALNGTTPVNSTNTDWKMIHTVTLSAACAGVVTVQEASGDLAIVTIPVGTVHVSDKLFSGFLDSVTRRKVVENSTSTEMLYDCSFVDVAQVLERRICLRDWSADTIGGVIDDILSDDLTDEGFYRSWGGVDCVDDVVSAVEVKNLVGAYKTYAAILNELAQLAGCVWWVDPYRVIHMTALTGSPTPAPTPAPFTISESAPVRNLLLSTTKGEYRNREYFVYDKIDATDTTELKTPDDQTTSWATARRVYDLKSVHLSAISRRVGPSGDDKYTVIADAEPGGAFVAAPGTPPVPVTIQSTDGSDTRNVTVYGVATADATLLSVSTKALNGLNPVTMDYSLYAVVGVRVSSPADMDVIVKWAPGGDPTTICTIPGPAVTAGIFTPADVDTEYFVKPTVWVDQGGLSETWVGIREVTESSTAYHAVKVTGTEPANFAVTCGAIKEVYIGAVQDNVTVKCEAEYQYTRGQIGIRVSSLADAPDATTYPTMTIVYTGMEEGIYQKEDGGDYTAAEMASLEGSGSGRYDHATILKEPILETEAEARATALSQKYGSFPKELSFETDKDWFFPGQKVTASLSSNFGEDGTMFIVSEVSMRERADTVTDEHQFQYSIRACSGEDFSAFDRMEIYRQLRTKQPYVAANNLTS